MIVLKKFLLKMIQRFGYTIVRNTTAQFKEEQDYKLPMAQIIPLAQYAPWKWDQEFQILLDRVKAFTLVDQYRLYELWQLAKQVRPLPGHLIEVGVWRGGSGAIIASASHNSGEVFLCDTFKGIVKAGPQDPGYFGGEHSNTSRQEVVKLIDALQLKNVHILEGIFPDETHHLIPSGQIKFVHIDVDVYQGAKDIFEWAWPKLVSGGLMIFDDYGFPTCAGVTQFVNEISQRTDLRFIYNLNGHGIVIKI